MVSGMRDIDIEAAAEAIEDDAGESIPHLRQALQEAKAGAGRVTTLAQVLVRSNAGSDLCFAEHHLDQ